MDRSLLKIPQLRNSEPWHVPRLLWHSVAVTWLPARIYLRFCDWFLFKVWWYSWPVDAWVERMVLYDRPDLWRFNDPK